LRDRVKDQVKLLSLKEVQELKYLFIKFAQHNFLEKGFNNFGLGKVNTHSAAKKKFYFPLIFGYCTFGNWKLASRLEKEQRCTRQS
jgi:hypothetical protein